MFVECGKLFLRQESDTVLKIKQDGDTKKWWSWCNSLNSL